MVATKGIGIVSKPPGKLNGGKTIESFDDKILKGVGGQSSVNHNLNNLNTNKQNHIMQDKHDWNKVVSNHKNWNEVKSVINNTMNNGTQEAYKNVSSNVLNVNGHNVRVVYKAIYGTHKILNAWVE